MLRILTPSSPTTQLVEIVSTLKGLISQQRLTAFTLALASAVMFVLSSTGAGLAKEEEKPQPNPLEITTPDPLLPELPVERPLSPLELKALKAAMDELNAQAATQLTAGDTAGAFDIWYREVRLRRTLGSLEEVKTLGRISGIAWENNRKSDIQLITQRLRTIQTEAQAKPPVDLEVLQALGAAYQQLREPKSGLEVYQLILADARERQDKPAEGVVLQTMAELHMAWFDYPSAATTYEELLTLATQQGDSFNQIKYLQQLAYIYEKAKQPENSLRAKQQLAESYQNQQNFTELPALKISIAADYEALGQSEDAVKNYDQALNYYESASQNYQEAYALAGTLQQFAYASEALQKLGNLYRLRDQLDTALEVYQVKIKMDQQSYNFYGLMNTYDQMGQIYLDQKNYPQALAAFQQGLELAKSLKYQETYFVNQIEQIQELRS